MSDDRVALYVRIPAGEAARLNQVAFARKAPKQEIVADLLARHLGDEPLGTQRRVTVELPDDGLTVGHAAVTAAPPPEVLTLEEAAALLQVEEGEIAALAEAGELPGRRIGAAWRFSRAALLSWLGG